MWEAIIVGIALGLAVKWFTSQPAWRGDTGSSSGSGFSAGRGGEKPTSGGVSGVKDLPWVSRLPYKDDGTHICPKCGRDTRKDTFLTYTRGRDEKRRLFEVNPDWVTTPYRGWKVCAGCHNRIASKHGRDEKGKWASI